MRSLDGRLFGDCYDQLVAEFPGAPAAKLRELALVKFAGEKATMCGAWEEVTRLANVFDRRARALHSWRAPPAKPGRPSAAQLRNRLEGRYASPRHTGEAREASEGVAATTIAKTGEGPL
jgi:hypothetical protein